MTVSSSRVSKAPLPGLNNILGADRLKALVETRVCGPVDTWVAMRREKNPNGYFVLGYRGNVVAGFWVKA